MQVILCLDFPKITTKNEEIIIEELSIGQIEVKSD